MAVELARRLIESGAPLVDVEAALLRAFERGVSLAEALSEHDRGLLARIEQELGRSDLPSVLTVRASPEVMTRLPPGLCQRLFAIPVHVDPRSGRVDVATVEPLDAHVAHEIAYHLDQPVRLLHASHDAIRSALDGLQRGAKVAGKPSRLPPALDSDAPIPLIKAEKPETSARSDAPIPLVKRAGAVPDTGDVGLSWRSRPPPLDLVQGAELERRAAAAAPPAEPPSPSVREQLEAAATPDAVLALLRDSLAPAVSIVFAVKSGSFDGRVASSQVESRTTVRSLSLVSHQPSVLENAVKSGFYLGPIPNTPNHRELRDALPLDTVNEVYVTVVTVTDRPSLVWLIAGFEQSLDLTRRADEVALLAGRALERILRQRKKGG